MDSHHPSMDDYVKIEKVGEGTYGVVYKARHTPSNTIRALKRIRFDDTEDGIPATAIREISVLKEMTGFKWREGKGAECIVRLYEVFLADSRLYLSFEFVDVDLHRYIHHVVQNRLLEEEEEIEKQLAAGMVPRERDWSRPRALEWRESTKFLWQILTGLEFLHMRRIIHRDLKPQNLLIDIDGNLKIADFGLARSFGVPMHSYTHEVVTLWYRAPEILLGTKHYGTAVDIWSVGAIWAEMITGQALFQGDSEIDQIFKIFRIWGTPSPEQWPALSIMPDYKPSFPKFKAVDIEELMPEMDDTAFDLFCWLMHFDAYKRATAKKALRHRLFRSTPRGAHNQLSSSSSPISEASTSSMEMEKSWETSTSSIEIEMSSVDVFGTCISGNAQTSTGKLVGRGKMKERERDGERDDERGVGGGGGDIRVDFQTVVVEDEDSSMFEEQEDTHMASPTVLQRVPRNSSTNLHLFGNPKHSSSIMDRVPQPPLKAYGMVRSSEKSPTSISNQRQSSSPSVSRQSSNSGLMASPVI